MKSEEEIKRDFEQFEFVANNLTTNFEPVMERTTSRWDVIPNGRRIKRKKKR